MQKKGYKVVRSVVVLALRQSAVAMTAGGRPSAACLRREAARPERSGQRPRQRQDKKTMFSAKPMNMNNENDQADRAISTGKLHTLLRFHTRPINVVVYNGSDREHSFSGWFPA